MKLRSFSQPPADGEVMVHQPDCPGCGPDNPMGLNLEVHRRGREVVGSGMLGPAFAGAPGRAHGGLVAAALDDLMGHILVVLGQPAYTARLTISYLAPTPIAAPLTFRAWLCRRSGRRLWVRAQCRYGGRVTAEATGLFISVEARAFAGRPELPNGGFPQ